MILPNFTYNNYCHSKPGFGNLTTSVTNIVYGPEILPLFYQVLIFITTFLNQFVEISVGHTPDSDDAFMFYGMFTGKVASSDF